MRRHRIEQAVIPALPKLTTVDGSKHALLAGEIDRVRRRGIDHQAIELLVAEAVGDLGPQLATIGALHYGTVEAFHTTALFLTVQRAGVHHVGVARVEGDGEDPLLVGPAVIPCVPVLAAVHGAIHAVVRARVDDGGVIGMENDVEDAIVGESEVFLQPVPAPSTLLSLPVGKVPM